MPDKPRMTREQIAQRAAQDLTDGAYVNLGWGIPNLISDYLPKGITVYFHSENGILGMGPRTKPGEEDYDLVDAMKVPVTLIAGASFFHQADAHLMTRGGHLDVAVLGGFQVSEKGDLANWKIPGSKGSGGIGGAMDIAAAPERSVDSHHYCGATTLGTGFGRPVRAPAADGIPPPIFRRRCLRHGKP